MNRRREKLISAIMFFASNTKYCGTTKTMKLLSFFEFEHFNQTGTPPIGLDYYAYPNGPLAFDLWLEIKSGSLTNDFADVLETIEVNYPDGSNGHRYVVKPGMTPNMKVFSPREKRILTNLVEKYRNSTAAEMSEKSHNEDQPWYKTIKEKGAKELIDYLYAIREDSTIDQDYASEKLEDYLSINSFFDVEPTIPEW